MITNRQSIQNTIYISKIGILGLDYYLQCWSTIGLFYTSYVFVLLSNGMVSLWLWSEKWKLRKKKEEEEEGRQENSPRGMQAGDKLRWEIALCSKFGSGNA